MMKNTILSILFFSCLSANIFAQENKESVTIQATQAIKKSVTVDVQMTDKDHRDVTITVNEDGEKKVIKWQDDGTIPDEIQKQLEAEDIDVEMLTKGAEDNKEMTIKVDGTNTINKHKEMIIITKREGGDDDEEKYEWNGQGEMPPQMKELLDKHDIEISQLGLDKKNIKKQLEADQAARKKMRLETMQKGRNHNMKTENQYKIISVDDNGEKKVMEWNGEGDAPEEMEDIHQEIEIMVDDIGNKTSIITLNSTSRNDVKLSDAYMGAQISAKGNAKIIEILKDSPTDKSNLELDDIIIRINGARVKSRIDLHNLLNYYEPNDEIELTVKRNGDEKKIKLKLGTRPEQFRL